jgi:hypothetical protein
MRLQLNPVITLGLGLMLAWLAFERGRFAIRERQIKFAREQVALFDEMSAKAIALEDEEQVREIRRYIVWYYPSGTKQSKGSDLDSIVESTRRSACAAVDAYITRLVSRRQNGRPKLPG